MDNEEPGIYEIAVEGASGIVWSDWLDDFIVTYRTDSPSITVLKGPMDQSALRGVLNWIWDLNLTVISVVSVSPAGEAEATGSFVALTAVKQVGRKE